MKPTSTFRRIAAIGHRASLFLFLFLGCLFAALAAPGLATAGIINNGGTATTLPAYSGAPSTAKPLKVRKPPRNPFLAVNGRSNLHNDAWMTDTYWGRGPIGANTANLSTALGRDCIGIAFDKRGRIVTACSNLTTRALYVIESVSLRTLDKVDLPYIAPPGGQDPFTNSSGGVYFYLDNKDHAVIGAADGRVLVYAVHPKAPFLTLDAEYDLSSTLAGDRITSVMPDWQGRIWFVGRYTGLVGVLDPTTKAVRSITLGEEIENSFAVDVDGVYVVTNVSMYRLAAGTDNVPSIVWSEAYQNSGVQKIGQFNAGSGTTPTLMNDGFVAITDNADPMNVVVYRKDAALAPGQDRVVCRIPVFGAGASATENSLVAVGNSLIVENNFGYYLTTTLNGPVSTPGVTRIDVATDGSGCQVVWTSAERAPSCVPKVSTTTGLVYLYTKDPDPLNTTSDAWFWTAVDFRTGATVWKQLAGTGIGFNNHYASIALAPKGDPTAFIGTIGGIVALRERQ